MVDHWQKNDNTERARGLVRKTMEETGVTALRLQTGGRHVCLWETSDIPGLPSETDILNDTEKKKRGEEEITHVHTRMHTRARTHARTHTHPHTHTHTHTHTPPEIGREMDEITFTTQKLARCTAEIYA